MKLDVGEAARSLHRACNDNGVCEPLPLSLLGVSLNIQQWCLLMYIMYFLKKSEEMRPKSCMMSGGKHLILIAQANGIWSCFWLLDLKGEGQY